MTSENCVSNFFNSLHLNYLFFFDSVHLSKSILFNFSLMESMLINYKPMSGTLVFTASVTPYGSGYISPITNNGPQKIKNSFYVFFMCTHTGSWNYMEKILNTCQFRPLIFSNFCEQAEADLSFCLLSSAPSLVPLCGITESLSLFLIHTHTHFKPNE